MKKRILTLALIVVSVFALAACNTPAFSGNGEESDKEAIFEEAMQALEESHYKDPSRDDLYQGAIEGMFDSLEDPYSQYFSREEYEQFHDGLSESFVGIGVSVENVDGTVIIRKVWADSPAQEAGLQPGDAITHIDGESYEDKSYYETVADVQGEVGTTVEIGVSRVGVQETITFEMDREEIENPTVVSNLVTHEGETIGVIEVNSFGGETFNNFKNAVEDFENQGIDGLIVDLRDNGGGYLNTVDKMLNLFLAEGDLPMFTIEQRIEGEWVEQPYEATGTDTKDYPVLTVVNDFSASASEVFAAAMKEKGGYDVLGIDTFGKGTMQSSQDLEPYSEDELHISRGRWLTPEGNWVDPDVGDIDAISPTIRVEQNPLFKGYNVYLSEGETLEYDTVSPRIENAQRILNTMDYDIRSDGYFDSETESAVQDYQSENGLEITGVIDAATASELSEYFYEYRTNKANDTQYQAALDYFIND
ncbi:MAG: S41 family peptidase [Bacillota bacterium]